MGRKTKLTKTVQGYICAAVERGANVEMRCHNGGIRRQTYHNWLNAGEEARKLEEQGQPLDAETRRFVDFLDAIEAATTTYAFTLQQVIADAAERDPAEARRELQRLYPQDYAPPAQRTQLLGHDGGALLIHMTWGEGDSDGRADATD